MAVTRLIERWLPIAEIGIESTRERTPITPFPAPNRLHVWWARRPLVASRAAVLASLLPADADRETFLHMLRIHGDPVAARRRIAQATQSGERLGADAYGYRRGFSYTPTDTEKDRLAAAMVVHAPRLLDPTAGGGSIPFEALRLGLPTYANDLNPVASLIERATIEWPADHGDQLREIVEHIGKRFMTETRERLEGLFPDEPESGTRPDGYLWARTVTCPYCDGLVPLSPNWRLAPDGTGVTLLPDRSEGPGAAGRVCSFEIVGSAQEQFPATVAGGDAHCPYADCRRVIDGDDIKAQAQAGRMGDQLFAVVYKRRIETRTKSGKRGRDKWVRGYRAPRPGDDNAADVRARLDEKLPEWNALDILPSESIGEISNYDRGHRLYGMARWADMFSPRQLLCHGTSVELFRDMVDADRAAGCLDDARQAAYGYLAIALSKLTDWNSRGCTWHPNREVIGHTFQRHNFAFSWSYAEMAPLVSGLGYDWTLKQTAKCIRELVALIQPDASGTTGRLFDAATAETADRVDTSTPRIAITCKPRDSLDHIDDGSIDAVVMDPPYYDNVMYAELSDFFYVWLKRTAGRVFPELFRRQLTDKENEAVANPARFSGQRGARALAGRDYQQRMAAIFAECRRVLKPDGIMTVMFTHKATGAWDALTTGLMESRFAITASWPISTEAGGSLHIRDKAAANSTVFLVCRPRAAAEPGDEIRYWEDVEPHVATAVRKRVEDFQRAGIGGVDLFLAAFGPALEEFSRHWPLQRGEPRDRPAPARGRRATPLLDEPWDPYAVTPEDALHVARREVTRWWLEKLTHMTPNADLDPTTAFFVLAWHTFRTPVFDYDEALQLARAVGIDLDRDLTGRLAHKSGSKLTLWDSARRAAKGVLGPADGSRGMIDALHHAAHAARGKSLAAARELLDRAGVDRDPRFFAALEAVLEVLPMSPGVTGMRLVGDDLRAAGNDFEALYNLSRLAYGEQVGEPDQLALWRTANDDAAAG